MSVSINNNINELDSNYPPKKIIINRSETNETFDSIPENLFGLIISFLNEKSLKAIVRVSKDWQRLTITNTAQTELIKINSFNKLLINYLKKNFYLKQKEKLENINKILNPENLNNNEFLKSTNLTNIKSLNFFFKKKILFSLSGLNLDDYNNLNEISKQNEIPRFFNDIFDIHIDICKIKELKIEKLLNMVQTFTQQGLENATKKTSKELICRIHLLKPHELVNITLTFASLKIKNDCLLNKIAHKFKCDLENFNPQENVKITRAFASLGIKTLIVME